MRYRQYLFAPSVYAGMARSMKAIMPLHNMIRRALYDGKVMHRQLTPLDETGDAIQELITQHEGPQ
jgi:hypothetical protein